MGLSTDILESGFKNTNTLRAKRARDPYPLSVRKAVIPKDSDVDPVIGNLEDQWEDNNFWVPGAVPRGYPAVWFRTDLTLEQISEMLTDEGRDVIKISEPENAAKFIDTHPQIVVHGKDTSYDTYTHLSDIEYSLLGKHRGFTSLQRAYHHFMTSPMMRTEDMWSMFGAYPWLKLEKMIAEIPKMNYDSNLRRQIHVFVEKVANPNITASECNHYGDTRLWNRIDVFKRRHYYDMTSFLRVLFKSYGIPLVRGGGGSQQRRLFKDSLNMILFQLCSGPATYERIYLTIFWIFTSKSWPTIAATMLKLGTLSADDDTWRATHKEITATITQTWMMPLTNKPNIMSMCFLDAETFVGWSDRDPVKGDLMVEIIEYAIADFRYVAGVRRGAEQLSGSPELYLQKFREGTRKLLEPMYQSFGSKTKEYGDFMDERSAWAAGGAVGKRAREILGPLNAPQGCSKAYTASKVSKDELTRPWGTMRVELGGKGNEKGSERTLLATDLHDQCCESYLVHMFKNKYGLIGMDVGETPCEMMARHACIAGSSKAPLKISVDEETPVLAAWDYSKWDHYVMAHERIIACEVMRELIKTYVRERDVPAMLDCLHDVQQGHEEAFFRAKVFSKDEYDGIYHARAAAAVEASGGMARWVDAETIAIKNPNMQYSGKRLTLENNCFYSRARLDIRDSEIPVDDVAIARWNRADDVLERYGKWHSAKIAIETMVWQGHKCNPKKQVTQVRNGVYFKKLYANGSMRGFPARAVYACCTSGPEQAASGGFSPIERLRSISEALDRLARQGSSFYVCRRLYEEAEHYYSDIRLQYCGRLSTTRRRIPSQVLRAAPENGGLGINVPGIYDTDFSIKCNPVRSGEGREWSRRALTAAQKHSFTGVSDLLRRAEQMLEHDTEIKPSEETTSAWRRRWRMDRASQNGKGDILRAKLMENLWRIPTHWHIDKKDTPLRPLDMNVHVEHCLTTMEWALSLARSFPGDKFSENVFAMIASPPASGMLEKLWFGLAGDHVTENPGDMRSVAVSTIPGRRFMQKYAFLPDFIILHHLKGKLGPCGPWSRAFASSWMPWLSASVDYVTFSMLGRGESIYSNYQLIKMRSRATSELVRACAARFPELLLH